MSKFDASVVLFMLGFVIGVVLFALTYRGFAGEWPWHNGRRQ
jgi:hypothetical protein